MPHPVYPFKALLRSLRAQAGLSVLGTAEATEYWNYERWESGQTRVTARNVGAIAAAFGVTDELWLLLYAWLADRYVPTRGQGSVDLQHANIIKALRQLPADVVDLGPNKDFVIEPGRHLDLALLCVLGRYWTRQRVVLPPTRREALPRPAPGQSPLAAAYGGVVLDMFNLVARTIFSLTREADCAEELCSLTLNLSPMLTSPSALHRLAAEFEPPMADDLHQAARATARFRVELARLLEASTGVPPTDDDLGQLAIDLFAMRMDRVSQVIEAAHQRGGVPDPDPEPMIDLTMISTHMKERLDEEIRQQFVEQIPHLDPVDLLDAISAIHAN